MQKTIEKVSGKRKRRGIIGRRSGGKGTLNPRRRNSREAVVEGGGKGGGKDDDIYERKGKGNTSNSSSSSESQDEFERNVREITSRNNVLTTKEELKEEKGDDGMKYNGCQKELKSRGKSRENRVRFEGGKES